MKKLKFLLFGLLLIAAVSIIWLHGPNYFLPLPDMPVIEDNAIQMPVGKFFYVKRGNEFAAIKIIRLTWNKGAIYECYYQGDGTGNFRSKSVVFKKGEVYENYIEKPISSEESILKDKGSKLNMECGPFKIEWSNQNWIYFEGYGVAQSSFEIVPTMLSDISQVNVKDDKLKWITNDKLNKKVQN